MIIKTHKITFTLILFTVSFTFLVNRIIFFNWINLTNLYPSEIIYFIFIIIGIFSLYKKVLIIKNYMPVSYLKYSAFIVYYNGKPIRIPSLDEIRQFRCVEFTAVKEGQRYELRSDENEEVSSYLGSNFGPLNSIDDAKLDQKLIGWNETFNHFNNKPPLVVNMEFRQYTAVTVANSIKDKFPQDIEVSNSATESILLGLAHTSLTDHLDNTELLNWLLPLNINDEGLDIIRFYQLKLLINNTLLGGVNHYSDLFNSDIWDFIWDKMIYEINSDFTRALVEIITS